MSLAESGHLLDGRGRATCYLRSEWHSHPRIQGWRPLELCTSYWAGGDQQSMKDSIKKLQEEKLFPHDTATCDMVPCILTHTL